MPNLSDISGSEFARMLKERVTDPLKDDQNHSRRVILYGPPGTGKTFIAKVIAGELGLGFKAIGVNDPAKDLINAAKFASRQSLVFFDQLEWINYRPVYRESLMNMPAEVLVVGASNYPWKLAWLLREGFPSWVFMAEPDSEVREAVFEQNLGLAAEKMDLGRLSELTSGYTAADIHYLCEWVGQTGPLNQPRIEESIGKYKPIQLSEWTAEAKAHADSLDREAFEPLHRWLVGK